MGSVLGGVLGYEIGHGSPINTGLGAAAGTYMGNSGY
ncbi:MAG: glycine zipper 2TM domain-containing protein [Methylococcales bacterium]